VKKLLFIGLQYCLPHHLLSRIVGKLASSEVAFIKNTLINAFAKKFGINWQEAHHQSSEHFNSFNDFFCRELKDGARPIASSKTAMTSPADGAISQLGKIHAGAIFQAKGHSFSTEQLLGSAAWANPFNDGDFTTIYLSPKDYHRVHMPVNATLRQTRYIPGRLFSVNPTTAENVPRLFARNERLVCMYDTEFGPMALVLVGAMIVAAIETVNAGLVAPTKQGMYVEDITKNNKFEKGDEMGRFKLGSTVILLFPKNTINWQAELKAGSPVKMGQALANITREP